ncbi:MAG: alpha/beta hydrolase [Ruminococcaceae bacterium]|nr:alpha/beta hydrolase [Oscillospiraceae bacterium]
MLFEKKVVDMVLGQLLTRQDNPHGIFYFGPEHFPGLQTEPYDFKSHKGHDLKGFFYRYEGADPKKLVVFDHGMGNGHRAYMREIETLCKAGFLVYSYDHTGCMASGGKHIGGFAQSLADLDDCIRQLKRDPLTAGMEICVVGHSWGGFSTMNIGAIHPEVKKIVSMSGFVSVERIVKQSLGPLKAYAPAIVAVENRENPRHSRYNALESLDKTQAKVLLIYSEDDKTVLKKEHYDPLYIKFCDSDHVKFLLLNGKNHNPTFETESVVYKDDFFAQFQKALKKGQLSTPEAQAEFMGRFDWWYMTKQDPAVWEQIVAHLKG